MKKRYEWRKLTHEGLLIEPDELGPHYDRMNINQIGTTTAMRGYKNEAEALHAYTEYLNELGDCNEGFDMGNCDEEFILITIYGKQGYPLVTNILKFE